MYNDRHSIVHQPGLPAELLDITSLLYDARQAALTEETREGTMQGKMGEVVNEIFTFFAVTVSGDRICGRPVAFRNQYQC